MILYLVYLPLTSKSCVLVWWTVWLGCMLYYSFSTADNPEWWQVVASLQGVTDPALSEKCFQTAPRLWKVIRKGGRNWETLAYMKSKRLWKKQKETRPVSSQGSEGASETVLKPRVFLIWLKKDLQLYGRRTVYRPSLLPVHN